MKLVAIPLDEHTREHWVSLWAPFLPRIAQRSHENVFDMIGQIARREVRLVLVMDGDKAHALIGLYIHQMGGKSYGDIIWMAGFGREQWQDLVTDLEQMLRDAGCVMCRAICRPGWSRFLKPRGYRLRHVTMEKPL